MNGPGTLARAMTIIESAKMNGLDPQAYGLHHRPAQSHPRSQDQQDRRIVALELGAADRPASTGRLMAAVTHVRTLGYVARILDEDVELLEAIVSNDDNLTYGAIISVYIGPDRRDRRKQVQSGEQPGSQLHRTQGEQAD